MQQVRLLLQLALQTRIYRRTALKILDPPAVPLKILQFHSDFAVLLFASPKAGDAGDTKQHPINAKFMGRVRGMLSVQDADRRRPRNEVEVLLLAGLHDVCGHCRTSPR